MLSFKLSQTAEYALRAMANLAFRAEGSAVTARELAGATGIPQAYLSKIMKKMVEGGLVHSEKGHGGGFVLARKPGAIRFLDVLEASGFSPRANHCVFGWEDCDPQAPCPFHESWARLNEAMETWALDNTLAGLNEPARPGGRPFSVARGPGPKG